MKIHLIRHGATETSGNCYAGRTDVSLTDEGHAEARALARTLDGARIGTVVTSPLLRAWQTAMPIARSHGLEPLLDPDLAEFDFGIFEGQPKRAIGLKLRKAHLFTPIPGGESLSDLWTRTGRAARKLGSLFSDNTEIVVVGHFWSNRMLYGQLMGHDIETACRNRAYRPETGSLVTLAPLWTCPAFVESI